MGSQALTQAAEVESKLVGRNLKNDSNAAATLVQRGSDLDAPTGFANLIAQNADMGKVTSAATALAARKMMLGKAAQLIVASSNYTGIVNALAAQTKTKTLAAASVACHAVMIHLAHEQKVRFQAGGGQKRGGRNNNKNKPKAAATASDVDLVASFLSDRSKEVQVYGLLAAAYMQTPALQEAVMACKADDPTAQGAKLRYLALNGQALPEELLKDAFSPRGQPRGPSRVDAVLSKYELKVPGQVLACEALALAGNTKHMDLIHEASDGKDIRARQAAIRAMADLDQESSIPILQAKVKKCNWIELVYVCDALGRMPHKDSIPLLVERYDDEEGRMRLDLMYALNSIVGELSFRQTADAWRAWWKEHGETFEVDKAKTKAFRAEKGLFDNQVPVLGDFYGVNIYSDRLVFVLDTSMSMKGDKIQNLRDNTVMTLEGFPKHVMYNMVDFGGWITVLYPGGLTGDTKMGVEWAKEMPMSWGTRSYDAIERGVEFDEADTIYFLSDGAPVISHCNKWNGIHAMALLMNRFRPMAIFTVCFQAGGGNAEGMRILAETNYGQTTNIE